MVKRMGGRAGSARVFAGMAGLGVLALSACGGGSSTRQDAILERRAAAILAEFDADGDRVVSREELDRRRTTSFRLADLNADGFVTTAEANEARARLTEITPEARGLQRLAPRALDPSRMDANGDGAVSLREYLALPIPLLVQFDDDKDGRVTRDELETPRPTDDPF